MLNLKLLQKEPETVQKAFDSRGANLSMEDFNKLDTKRRNLLSELEALNADRNRLSAEVGKRKKAGEDASELIEQVTVVNNKIGLLDASVSEVRKEMDDFMLSLPNIPHSSVPQGTSEEDNVEVLRKGESPAFPFPVKDHAELGINLCGLDFERGAKLAGSRFTVSMSWAARLERALSNYYLDVHAKEGRIEVMVPLLANRKTMTGTGQLPKFAEDLFHIADWDYFLIPTSEVPITNLYADEVLEEEALPLRYCALSPCFRSEAGAYGKDTRGLIRQHQFNKVEMVTFAHPDDSYAALEDMRQTAERLLESLELPFRTVVLCTGDMGFAAAKTYDIEVWLPGQNTYREISSCSNCEDFQARRANIRYRPKGGKSQFLHTLNGSGLPTGRSLVAILENGQQKDGSIVLPKKLVPYMGGLEVIEPR